MKTSKQILAESLVMERRNIDSFAHEMSKAGVYVVKPGELVSGVFFRDERRYFPKVNEEDIVVGGYFG